MCRIVSTEALHRELFEYFEESEPSRAINDKYVAQFEPWRGRRFEALEDEELQLVGQDTVTRSYESRN